MAIGADGSIWILNSYGQIKTFESLLTVKTNDGEFDNDLESKCKCSNGEYIMAKHIRNIPLALLNSMDNLLHRTQRVD